MSDQQHTGPGGGRSGVDAGYGTDSGPGDRIQSGAATGSGTVQAAGTSHDPLVGDEGTGAPGAGLRSSRGRLTRRDGARASMVVADNQPSGTVVTLTVPYQAQVREGANKA